MGVKQLAGIFALAGASLLLAQSEASVPETAPSHSSSSKEFSPDDPLRTVREILGPDTVFKVNPKSISQGPIGSDDPPRIYTSFTGTIQDGPREGDKFEVKCAADDCVLTVKDKAGRTATVETRNGTVLMTYDPETLTVDARNNGRQPRRYTEFVGPPSGNGEVVGSACLMEERTIKVLEKGETVDQTILDYTKCKPLDPGQLIDVEAARNGSDTMGILCKNGPIGFEKNINGHMDFFAAAKEFAARQTQHFKDLWNSAIKGTHPKFSPDSFLSSPSPQQ